MPKMTRTHYNLIADATNRVIEEAKRLIACPQASQQFALATSKGMAEALAGTNSQFKFDRFRDRCLGIRRGR